ncbi:hypothetical protein B0T20DRAFT_200697 [Sordaria brevicollis]|uniref:Uncharacterized protein n=1 Tax=Sordaria brevicollis TaxID=83679 RepID=A0AAE0PDY7_SORBR|nr:hypothetical protein B0T20DRAFT_200697 [Sordaria brevicollis]
MGFLRLFSRRSGNKSVVDASPKSLDYESMVAGAPPVLGTKPAKGNGPLVIKILPRDISQAQIAVRTDGLVNDEFPISSPIIPGFRAEDIERPSSAPNGFRTPSRSLGGGGSLRAASGTRSPLSRRAPPLSFRMGRPETSPMARSVSQNGVDAKVALQPQVAPSTHSRSNSIVSNAGSRYRDIIEAHSEIKPINFKIRIQATGTRDFGEDVAERNLGENGHNLDSPSVKAFYARSSMIFEKSKADEITKQFQSESNSHRDRARTMASKLSTDLSPNTTNPQTLPRATTSHGRQASAHEHPDGALSLGLRLPVDCNLQRSRSVNTYLLVESTKGTSVPKTTTTTEQDLEVDDHPPVIEWPLRTCSPLTLKPSPLDVTPSLAPPVVFKPASSPLTGEQSTTGDRSPVSIASSVKCFAVNPEYHHERPWSSSSSTLSISDLRSNPSSPSRSQHTADTSVNLSQTSFKIAPQLPSLTFLPIPEAPDNFNIDDYISTDASSIKGHQRHTGESEEELLFNDFGYGAQGTQLPGLLDSSTLFERATSPIPIPNQDQNKHCRCSSWATTPINAGSFGKAVGGQSRFILDTGVEDESDETDQDSGLISPAVVLHSPKPQHPRHALKGEIYNGVIGHVPRTMTFGSDRTASMQGASGRGKKRTPVVLNCKGIQQESETTARPFTPKNKTIATEEMTPKNARKEKGKERLQEADDKTVISNKQLAPSTPTTTTETSTAAVVKRRKQIKSNMRATEPVKRRRPQTSSGVVTTPKTTRSSRIPLRNLRSLQRPMTAGAGDYSDEEHHADTEG